MSHSSNNNPRFEQAINDDAQLLDAHEKALGPKQDDGGNLSVRPLVMLFVLSSFILFAATYVNRYSGHFNNAIYNETALPHTGGEVVAKADPVAAGKKLFNSPGACYTCHQPTGQGIAGVYPPLANSDWATGSEERLVRILLQGLKGQVTVSGVSYPGAAAMPAFGSSGYNWSDEKIANVLTYVRQEWGNKAPAITAETVARIRAAAGDRKEWTSQELLSIK
jgi:mono/diheme cytochrome c family protein